MRGRLKTQDRGLVQEAMFAGARLTGYVDTQIAAIQEFVSSIS